MKLLLNALYFLAADPITWVLIIGGVVIIIAVYVNRRLRGPSNAVGINAVTISATPTTVSCGSGTKFVVTVDAFGHTDSPNGFNYRIEILDDETFVDKLDEFVSSNGGATRYAIIPVTGTGGRANRWEATQVFNLHCDSSCYVAGSSGSSGESDPLIYAKMTLLYGSPQHEMISNKITLNCVEATS